MIFTLFRNTFIFLSLLCFSQAELSAQALGVLDPITEKHWEQVSPKAQAVIQETAKELRTLCEKHNKAVNALLPLFREETAGRQGGDMEFSEKEKALIKEGKQSLNPFLVDISKKIGALPERMQPHLSEIAALSRKIYSQEARTDRQVPLYFVMHCLEYSIQQKADDNSRVLSYLVHTVLEKNRTGNSQKMESEDNGGGGLTIGDIDADLPEMLGETLTMKGTNLK